jgi:hypothetical protein
MGGLCPRRSHEADNEAQTEVENENEATSQPENEDENEISANELACFEYGRPEIDDTSRQNPSHSRYDYSPSGAYRRKPRTYDDKFLGSPPNPN